MDKVQQRSVAVYLLWKGTLKSHSSLTFTILLTLIFLFQIFFQFARHVRIDFLDMCLTYADQLIFSSLVNGSRLIVSKNSLDQCCGGIFSISLSFSPSFILSSLLNPWRILPGQALFLRDAVQKAARPVVAIIEHARTKGQ